jgi:hypothetical protein
MKDIEEMLREWDADAERPFLIIDEIRPELVAGKGQQVLFVCIRMTAGLALSCLYNGERAREQLGKQARDMTFKGRLLYGPRQRRSHEPMRQYVADTMRRISEIRFYSTSTQELASMKLTGGFSLIPAPGERMRPGRIEEAKARELTPMLTFAKTVAVDAGLGPLVAELLVDRSAQLGLDAKSRALGKDELQSLETEDLNTTSDGKPTDLQCPTRFRIIAAPDEGCFRDLLLLPDAVAYLANGPGRQTLVRVDTQLSYIDMDRFRAALSPKPGKGT